MRIVTSTAGGAVNKAQGGFTYILMLVAVAVVSLTAGLGVTLVSSEVQADREEELLFRGMAYREAIGRYHRQEKNYPPTLDALVSNPIPAKRYMRALYRDPMGGEKWQLILGAGGGIIGVASGSKVPPRKQAGFPEGYENLANARTYSEWAFIYKPAIVPARKN